jgi:hypothetical protein
VSPRAETWVAFALFLAIDLAYFGGALLDLRHRCACAAGTDPETYMWFLSWWPHAILHGHNPFVTSSLFAPDHVNLGAIVLLPGASLLMSPVTLLFGPLASYNLLAIAAPLLAAMTAFGLCRYVCGRMFPALVGGYLFGFSPYMLGHMLGHLDLVMVFPMPALVHVFLRIYDGRVARNRGIALMAVLWAVLYLSSPEMTLTFVCVSALGLGLAFARVPPARSRLIDAIKAGVTAGAIAVAVLCVFIAYALTGEVNQPFFDTFPGLGADALGFVVPTSVFRLGGGWFHAVSARFASGPPENGVYLSVPLLLILLRLVITDRSARRTQILGGLLAVVMLLAMGATLVVAGTRTVPLPWRPLSHLPLLKRAIPLRLGLYMYMIAAVLVALWLADAKPARIRRLRWLLALACLALLFPNLAAFSSRPDNPRFFTTDHYRQVLARGETVLALPWGSNGYSMLWQAETGFYFRMPGGYLGALLPTDYVRDPFLAPLSLSATNFTAGQLRDFLFRRHVGTVIVDAARQMFWPAVLAAAGLHGRPDRGVIVYRVPPTLPAPVLPAPAFAPERAAGR